MGTTSARALRARTGLPHPIARLPLLNLPAPVGRQPLFYLFDVGFTRDVWMHHIDLARAAAKTLDVDSDHDGRIVADLVAEWASTHGEPFTLSLSGAPGGQFRAGTGGEHSAGSWPIEVTTPGSYTTPFRKTSLFKQLSARGWRKNEPVKVHLEVQALFSKLIEDRFGAGMFGYRRAAEVLGLPAFVLGTLAPPTRNQSMS